MSTQENKTQPLLPVADMTPVQQVIYSDHIEKETNLKELFQRSFLPSQRAVSEEAFVFYFLPWLSGEEQDTTGQKLSSWLQIAGDTLTPVMLTDKTGQIVAVVPGIVDRNVIEIQTDRRKNMRDIMTKAEKIAELATNAAFEQTFTGLVDAANVKKREPTKEWLDAWGALLTRYGKHPAQKALQPAIGSDASAKPDNDKFEFEED